MSPRRQVKRAKVVQRKPLDYVWIAIAVLGVAGATALTIWLIRPGGYASNQPRIATVLFGSACVFALAFWVSRGPDRPVIGRLTIWGSLAILIVLIVAVGYVLQETTKWKHVLVIFAIVAGGILAIAVVTECGLLIRRLAQENLWIRVLMSAAVALIAGAAGALLWPGGIKIERPTTPTVPAPITAPVPSTIPAVPTTSPAPPSSTP